MTPAVAYWQESEYRAYVGTDKQVWFMDANSTKWQALGGVAVGGVSLAISPKGAVTVAVEGSDQAYWERTRPAASSTWGAWVSKGGKI
jgi:hypothetical protein